jgi:hypothetical protein
MSWEARKWADKKSMDYELDPTTRLVLDRLANHANRDLGQQTWPGLSRLELETGLSERTIRRCIKKLLAIGLMEYGDQSIVEDNPRYRNDQLPKVYRLLITRKTESLEFSDFAPMPQKQPRRRLFGRKPKPAPVQNRPPRPDTVSPTTGQTDGHKVHQTVNPEEKPTRPSPDAVPASPEVIDHEAVMAFRQACRDRLAQKRGLQLPRLVPADSLVP